MISKRSGFSLVELSIVLVVLGLLVGGVLSGQSLIRAAELRSISTEYGKFNTARLSFRDKYFALPGDMSNAYQFWGAACGANATTSSTGCNGDGDGIIETIAPSENVKAWEHMVRAGLIEGSYDGVGVDIGSGQLQLSVTNTPRARLSNAYWDITNDTNNAAFVDDLGNAIPSGVTTVLILGSIQTGSPYLGALSTLTHAEAWNIDTKLDDGRANKGKIHGDTVDQCYDVTPTDVYGIQAAGADFKGDCQLYFTLQ